MQGDRIKVWDPLVRVFHWSLVASIAITWFTAEDFRRAHEWVGYAALALVALRFVWGFVGSRYSRFAQFVRAPASVWRYARQITAGEAPRHIGHNPLGGWMVLALMLTVAAIGTTGWMLTLDAFFGDGWLQTLHAALATGLLGLAALHVAGAVVTGWEHGENLVRAMVSGNKRSPDPGDIA